ncbi:MAG TPA: YlmC/YmxH family sporulation protein [Candidatus Pullichristensenella avicola]|nr:YlmC/YmxH family sporulation protein [Candidatus Pullichristensenella avicola]
MRVTFGELKQKDVINICDGRRLGKPIDLALNNEACVSALIVPGPGGFLNCLRPEREGVSIPWERIRRIGDDVILVELDANFAQ